MYILYGRDSRRIVLQNMLNSPYDCLIYEMLFIQEKKPKLNTQSDSIKAKLFST